MSTFTLQEHTPSIQISTPQRTGGEALVNWRRELDGYYKEMVSFSEVEPDEIFRSLSAWTARASYMRSQIVRIDSKAWVKFRTQEIDPFISECDRQFRVWSRVFAVQSLDWNMSRGQT